MRATYFGGVHVTIRILLQGPIILSKNKKPRRESGVAGINSSLPASALPASGSRGLPHFYRAGLSASGSPALSFQNKTRVDEVNDVDFIEIDRRVCPGGRSIAPDFSLFGRWLFLRHVRVKDGAPFAILHLPDRTAIVGP